jgi:putative ABC transport system permease protein
MPLGPAMKHDLSAVVDYTRFIQPFETYLHQGATARREFIPFADASFFRMFSFPLLEGDPSSVLNDPHSLVLTEETARRLFGNKEAVGQTVEIRAFGIEFQPFTVTGVARDIPANSSITFNMLANFKIFEMSAEGKGDIGNWARNSFLTFIQLQPGSRLAADQRSMMAFASKYITGKGQARHGLFALEPITQMHTDTGFGFFMKFMKVPPVDPAVIWILLSIAAGVLLISCINFTTLSVGRSAHRAREVGVRKAIGGSEGNLRRQFLAEAFGMTLIAFALGIVMAEGLLPFFNEYTGRKLSFSLGSHRVLPGLFVVLIGVVTLLSGSYPAWMLSRFRAVDVLKSKFKFGGSNGFTKALVTMQFVLSAGLIIGAIVMLQQLHFMQSKDPGFAKENVVVLEALGIADTKKRYAGFKQGLAACPAIAGTASAENGLGEHEGLGFTGYDYGGKSFMLYPFFVDADYVPVLGLQVIAGRNLSREVGSDTLRSVLINEAMVRALGWTPATAIGRQLKNMPSGDALAPPTVIGVVKDINFLAMDQAIPPQLFHNFAGGAPYRFFVRIRPGDPSRALAAIEKEWKTVAPGYSLRYNFLDEDLDRYYTAEKRLSRIIGWAGSISISLACLGLFGLAMLAVLNRTKEIGIRKILGASLPGIIGLVSKDFLRLVTLAFLIAAPLAGFIMHRWLEGYYYRIQLSWWVFALTGMGILATAWITVGLQAFRTASANPVKSLRVE